MCITQSLKLMHEKVLTSVSVRDYIAVGDIFQLIYEVFVLLL
jgi:hypothetical protein